MTALLLIRQGQVHVDWHTELSPRQLPLWQQEYAQAPLSPAHPPPPGLGARVRKCAGRYASRDAHARTSLEWLTGQPAPVWRQSQECPLPPPPAWSHPQLRPAAWLRTLHAMWLLGLLNGAESPRQARRRSAEVTADLQQELRYCRGIALVTGPIFLRLLGQQMQAEHWRCRQRSRQQGAWSWQLWIPPQPQSARRP